MPESVVMRKDERAFWRNVKRAVETQNVDDLRTAVGNFSAFCFEEADNELASPGMSDELVEKLADLLTSHALVRMPGSVALVMLFEQDWARLSINQVRLICTRLEQSFDRFIDAGARVAVAEILGEYWGTEEAFMALTRLAKTKHEIARADVVTGFLRMAQYSKNEDLRNRAEEELHRLLNDEGVAVRENAAWALSVVRTRG